MRISCTESSICIDLLPPLNSRAGFTYLLFGFLFPFYYTTIGQAVASMAPNAEIAALLFSVIFSFVLTL